jgi:hypothetical protein
MTKANLDIIYIISRHFVILWAPVLPWYSLQLRRRSMQQMRQSCISSP